MGKKYVSQALNADAEVLYNYLAEGNITPVEYFNYFKGVRLPYYLFYSVLTTEEFIINYFQQNSEDYSLRTDGRTWDFIRNKLDDGTISKEAFHKYFFKEQTPLSIYVNHAFENISMFKKYFRKNFEDVDYESSYNAMYAKYSYDYQRYVISLLENKKINFEEYKEHFNFPVFQDKNGYGTGLEGRLAKQFKLKKFDFGDLSKYEFNSMELKHITKTGLYYDSNKYNLLKDYFDWEAIAENPRLKVEFIAENLDKLSFSTILKYNKKIDLDFCYKHLEEILTSPANRNDIMKHSYLSIENVFCDDRYYGTSKKKYRDWTFEEVQTFVDMGLLKITSDTPTNILKNLYQKDVYRLGYKKEMRLNCPVIEGFKRSDYQKIVDEAFSKYMEGLEK